MGNYERLKQSVSDVIKTNGNQEITGSILQNVLLTIISTVGANATFAGIATPATNPGTPDGPVFYLASESGTYNNFNAIELQDGLSVLMWNGSWSSQQIFGIDDEPTAESDNLVKNSGVANKTLIVSSHSHPQRDSWGEDTYQDDKLYSVFCELNKDYKGYTIRLIQMGWLESIKKFLFDAKLYKNGTYKNAATLAVEYNSIPLTDERYKCDLYDGENKIGFLTFVYNWSKINGDTTFHLLNDATVEDYDIYHIEVSNISFSYNEIEPTFNAEDYFTKNETKNLVEETFIDAGIIIGEKNTYGRKDSYAYDGHFSSNENLVVTIKNSNAQKSGLLQTLTINVYTPGKFKIGIGHMDQRGWYLEVGSFDIETTEIGYITFDLRNRLIYIPKDEQIFIYCGHYGDETIAFNAGVEANGFFFGPADSALSYFPNGGKCTIQYEVQETESTYAGKAELEKTNENVANANTVATTALNNNFKAKDRAGNLYKLLVVNGVLRVLPMQYSNVLVIGNSLCEHPQTEDYGGWYASGRGMASSVTGNDYCGILQAALRRTSPSAVVTRNTNFTSWFRNPTDLSNAKFAELFNGTLSNNYDIVVFRLSENNNVHIDLMKDAIVALINYIWSQLPNCDAIITSDVMDGNADKNAQLSAAAVELDVPYVNAICADRVYKYADVNWSYAPYYYQGDDMNLYPIQKMFASHINDYGMLKVANAILSGIGYSPIELAHNVIVNTSVDYMAQAQGVENGIFTVLLYGTAPSSYTVTDANNNTIQATLHDMNNISYYSAPDRTPAYAITFVMPTSDVTISIS